MSHDRKLCQTWHPDKCTVDKKQLAETKFKQIKDAYDAILKGGHALHTCMHANPLSPPDTILKGGCACLRACVHAPCLPARGINRAPPHLPALIVPHPTAQAGLSPHPTALHPSGQAGSAACPRLTPSCPSPHRPGRLRPASPGQQRLVPLCHLLLPCTCSTHGARGSGTGGAGG